MTQLTPEQIKTLEAAFASYPEGFTGNPKLTTMEGIQEQLKSPSVDVGGNVYVAYITPYNKNGFSIHKLILENKNEPTHT